jgi:hypothetical protein
LAAGLLLPQQAAAELPFSTESLGRVEAILDACSQFNPTTAAKYEEWKTAQVAKLPKKELAEARASDQYRNAYADTTAEIENQAKEKLIEACAAFLKSEK